jgi:crotonobetainyl-CoA:carnitine CoA-transferase CaiB-like acyl-CoA transferase
MRIGEQLHPDRDSGTLPLDGVTVLSAEQMISLPYMTQLLAMLGATVIKVEPPGGEPGRASVPFFVAEDGANHGATFARANLNKSSIVLDLKQPAGRDLFLRLAPGFDIIAENMRPGVMDRLGLGYEVISSAAPRSVYLSVSGFGNLDPSPYREWPAYAPVVEAMSGLYEMGREPGQRLKTNIAGALGDVSTAVFAAVGVLAALRRRDRTGEGERVDVAMLDSMIAINDMYAQMWSLGATVNGRRAGVMGSFRAADGDFVMAALREHQLERLARLLGREDWLTDPALSSRRDWYIRTDELIRPAVETWASEKTKLEASEILAQNGIAAGPSFTPADLAEDPHVRTRGMLVEVEGAQGTMQISGNPIKFSRNGDGPVRRFPDLGADTAAVLTSRLGLSADEITELQGNGTIN